MGLKIIKAFGLLLTALPINIWISVHIVTGGDIKPDGYFLLWLILFIGGLAGGMLYRLADKLEKGEI